MVSNKTYRAPQLNLKRSKISLQKISPSSNSSLEKRISTLEINVNILAKSINKEADLERKAQRDYEKDVKRREENKLKSSEEKELEKKLSKSIISPVQNVGSKAGGILGKLKSFFMLLLGGWLTNRGFDALKAYAEGNISELKSIGIEVGKVLGIVAGTFALLSGGIFGIIGIIGKITFAILSAPFKLLAKGIGALWNKVRNKPPTPNAGGGGGGPNAGGGGGVPSAGVTPRGGSRIPGAQGSPAGRSTFDLEQARKTTTQQNMMRNDGPKGPFDMIKRWIRGKLEQNRHVGKGKHIVRILDGAVKTFNWFSKLPGFKQIFGVIRSVINFVTNPKSALGNIFKKMTGSGKGGGLKLLRILQPLLFALAIRNRAQAGMSPAQAIIGGLFPLAGSIAGGALGGTIGAAGGPLAFFGALGGSFLGGMLGEQLMGVLDNFWTPNRGSWDNFAPFKAINESVYDLQSGDNAFAKGLQAMFPYEGTETYKQTKQSAQVSSPTEPAAAPAAPAAEVTSSTSSMPSAPGPVSGGGNTTVIYKKVRGAGGGMGQVPLKTGSATDVPLIASANPSNFYTMYSQLLYNVVI